MAIFGEPMPEPAIPFASVRSLLDTYKRRHPEKIAVHDLDQHTSITYAELHEVANQIARFLHSRGIKEGDKVALLSDENLEKLLCWIGIWRLGAVVCPLNVEMNQAHVKDLLTYIDPKMVLWHQALAGLSYTASVSCETIMFSTWQGNDSPASGEFFALLRDYAATPEVDRINSPDDVAAIFCTSGTTSRPKCVVFNHLAYWLNGLSTLDMLGLTAEDRTLEYRSFGWNSAQILSLMPWLQTGLSLHMAPRFSHSRFFDWIKTHGITFAAGVPTVVNMLLNEPLGVTAHDLPTLRLMTCSTAPLSPQQWQRFEQMYGVTLLQLYGMSEAGWICGNRYDKRKMGTVGPAAKHQQFLIVDSAGNPRPPGIEGEVTVGGPQTCLATIAPDGTYEDLSEARIKTGDLAIMDEEGFVRVTGRTKDLIIRGGVNISPLEIDHVLMQHPGVLEAAAIGVPDMIYGEEIVCYVVAKSGVQLTAEALRRHCGHTLPDFKTPKACYLVEALPKNDRGKVKRDDLKELWARTNAAP
jgi:acyl-coenzyme A synthetase/AMP-(fatty) acid ligase